jgi:low affinity Fe/Cu permease
MEVDKGAVGAGMKKLVAPIVIAALLLLCLTLLDRACNSDAALVKAKADYADLKRTTEADHALALGRIADLERTSAEYVEEISTYQVEIAARDTTIATLRGKVTTTDSENARLRTEVQPVIDANPALAEFVASLDAGIVLRNALIVEQDAQIKDLKEQGRLKDERLSIQVRLTDEWKAAYDKEHALRVASEGLCGVYASRVKRDKIWIAVGKYGPPIAFAVGIIAGK